MKLSLSEEIYDLILDDIIAGKINKDTILTESMLIKKYQYSRTPIREALIKLKVDNIIYSIPRFGYRLSGYDNLYLDNILEFRLIVEPSYLELYFDRINKDEISNIEKSIIEMDKKKFSTPIDYWRKTSQFHKQLARVYKDKFFYEMLDNILRRQLVAFTFLYWDDWSNIIDTKLTNNHSKILDAIKEGNKDNAVKLLKLDIQSF